MTVSTYLDSVAGTEKEPLLLKAFTDLTEDEDVAKAFEVPVVGKLLKALAVLSTMESIEEFKQTEHYEHVKDWGITVFDLEKGIVSVHPGPKHMKVIFAVMAVVGLGLLLWKLKRKHGLSVS